jgi:hypothetical protein
MPKIEPVVRCLTECFDDPIDRIAGAVVALAVYDAMNQVSRKTKMTGKTIRNNSAHIEHKENQRQARKNRAEAARRWLRVHGIYWMDALGLEPTPIMEVICDD